VHRRTRVGPSPYPNGPNDAFVNVPGNDPNESLDSMSRGSKQDAVDPVDTMAEVPDTIDRIGSRRSNARCYEGSMALSTTWSTDVRDGSEKCSARNCTRPVAPFAGELRNPITPARNGSQAMRPVRPRGGSWRHDR
jgi:hypothetical protein